MAGERDGNMRRTCRTHGLPVDRGWAWAVAVGAAINTFWSLGSFSVYGVIFVEVIDMYSASSALSAIMFSIFMATCCVAVFVQALITGKVSERTLSLIAGVSFSLSLTLQYFSPNVYFFIIIFGILGGIGSTFTMYTGIVVLGVYFDRKLSIASGLAFIGASTGQFVIPQILKVLLSNYGFRGAMLILGACHLHPMVSAMLFRPPSYYQCSCINGVHTKDEIHDDTTAEANPCDSISKTEPLLGENRLTKSGDTNSRNSSRASIGQEASVDDGLTKSNSTVENGSLHKAEVQVEPLPEVRVYTIRQSFKLLACMPRFHVFAAGRCLCVVANYLLILFIPPLAVSLGFTVPQVSLLLTVMGVIDLPSRPFHGWLVSLNKVDVTYYVGATSLICSLIVLVCTFVPSTASVYVMGILMTVLYNPNLCLMNVITISAVGQELFARALMLFMMVTYALLTFLPIVFGLLYDVTSSYTIPMAICAGSGVMGGVLTLVEKGLMRTSTTRTIQQSASRDVMYIRQQFINNMDE